MTSTQLIGVIAALLVCAVTAVGPQTVRMTATGPAFSTLESDGPVLATIWVDNQGTNTYGWDVVKVESNLTNTSAARYYGGVAEGLATQLRIYQNWFNIQSQYNVSFPAVQVNWIVEHIQWMQQQVNTNQGNSFWDAVGDILQQVRGIAYGYSQVAPADQKLSFFDIFMLSFSFELYDVQTVTSLPPEMEEGDEINLMRKPGRRSHCSALVKPTAHDLFMSHDTWSGYNTMLRQYKSYTFGGRTVTLSGYPGIVHSGDDWYINSNGLTVQETTNEVYNLTLYRLYVVPQAVSEFIRVMVANYLAVDGKSWSQTFCTQNSGTYNNQYMVVNMNLYTPGQPLQNNTLWVLEQLPGYCVQADVTNVLISQGYWASYNIPYFPFVFAISGNLWVEQNYGSFFSYTNYSRAEIFRRDQGAVTDLQGMMTIMRYNNYLHDPFSIIPNCTGAPANKCEPPYSPWLSIASRGDLAPANISANWGFAWQYYLQAPFGAIDSKIAAWSTVKNLTGWIVAGPTSGGDSKLPPFQWSTSPFSNNTANPRLGQENLFMNMFVSTDVLINAAVNGSPSPSSSNKRAIIAGVVIAAVVFVGIVFYIWRRTRYSRKGYEEAESSLV